MTTRPEPARDSALAAWLQAEAGALPEPPADPEQALALAWALKAECQTAWHRQPDQLRQAARGLERLAHRHPGAAALAALSQWMRGLTHLVDGHMERALDDLQDSAARFDQLGQPIEAIRLRVPCLMALSLLGRHDDALAQAEQMMRALQHGGDELTRGKLALNHGSMLLRLDRYAQAADSYRQAAVAFAHAGDVAHSVMADIGLASTLTWQARFDEAELMFTRARQRASAHDLPVLQALALGELGQLHLHRGALAQALVSLDEAVELLSGRAAPQRCLEVERSRVGALLTARLLPETRLACQRLILEAEQWQAPMEAAWARLMRAEASLLAGLLQEAQQDLAAARSGFEAQSNAVGAARCDLLLARAWLALHQAEHASRAASAAVQAFAAAGLSRWHHEAQVLLARCQISQGHADAARQLLDAVADATQDAPQRAACEAARAELAEHLGDWDLAQTAAESARLRLEVLRLQAPSGDMRVAIQRDAEDNDDRLVRLAARRGDAGLLWQAMEGSRARSLHDTLQANAVTPPPAAAALDPPDKLMRTRLNWLQHQWQCAQAEGHAGREQSLLQALRAAEAEWLQHQRRQAARRHTNAAPWPQPSDAPPADAGWPDTLAPGQRLLMFHQLDEHWHAVLAGADGLQTASGPMAPVQAALQQLRGQIDSQRWRMPAADPHAAQRLQRTRLALGQLHDALLAPFRAALFDTQDLVILPHRSLHGLAWAALQDEQGPLVSRLTLTLCPSVTTWRHCAGRPRLDLAGLIRAGRSAVIMGVGGQSLPAAADEARGIASHIGAAATCLVDAQASLASFEECARQADLLHLACHATARVDSPSFSALHLHDGLLTADQVGARPVAARLVVLSACDTLISQIAPGDELLGLARGFLVAGARAVLATLWSVPDRSTAECMQLFYRGLGQGMSPARALRQAQCELATRWPHPFHWAPFVLLGAD